MISDILAKGGPSIWPIAILSIIALGIVLERMVMRTLLREDAQRLLQQITDNLQLGRRPLAQIEPARNKPLQHLAGEFFRTLGLEPEARIGILKREAERCLARWNAHVRFVSLTATLTPLIGLGGTVLGLVDAFRAIEAAGGRVNPADLAGGIWAALLSTIAGMLVAIPCTVAHHFLQSGTEHMARRIKFFISELDEATILTKNAIPFTATSGVSPTAKEDVAAWN